MKVEVSNSTSISKLIMQRSSDFESPKGQNTDTTQVLFNGFSKKVWDPTVVLKVSPHVVKTGAAVLQIHNVMVLKVTCMF